LIAKNLGVGSGLPGRPDAEPISMSGYGLKWTFGVNEMSRAVPDRRVGAATWVDRTLCQPKTPAFSMT
jgi:hypothetical protein